MRPQTAWQALTCRGFPLSSWPWRSLAYLASGVPIGAMAFVMTASLFVVGSVTAIVLVGIPLLGLLGLSGIPLAAVERRRLRLIDTESPVRSPHRRLEPAGPLAWTAGRYAEQATWRELAYAVLFGIVLWPLDLAAVTLFVAIPAAVLTAPLQAIVGHDDQAKILKMWIISTPVAWMLVPAGALLLVVATYGLTAFAGARGILARTLLVPREDELSQRLGDVSRSRARLVDAFEAERRRIERDLHDGAQQRVVALTVTLGMARIAPPDEVEALVAAAHGESKRVLDDLRELIRGIHPKILADRGLPAAVTELAARSPVPVDIDIVLPDRLPDAVETAAYFVVCEALSNIAKHSQAENAAVRCHLDGDLLILDIDDDGVGGATMAGGTGLTGLADRVSVIDGTLSLSSPTGGPTLLHVEMPCAKRSE